MKYEKKWQQFLHKKKNNKKTLNMQKKNFII
jgi:hypothetical protein